MSEIALIGKKIGMTREFYKTGQLVPVTVLKVEKAIAFSTLRTVTGTTVSYTHLTLPTILLV